MAFFLAHYKCCSQLIRITNSDDGCICNVCVAPSHHKSSLKLSN